jgi:nucleotide-binding universal stress UspA family protein
VRDGLAALSRRPLAWTSALALREFARELRCERGARVFCHLRSGKPAREIARLSDEVAADLIILGRDSRSAVSRMIFGSVSEEVVQQASCPVLAVTRKGLASPWPERFAAGYG